MEKSSQKPKVSTFSNKSFNFFVSVSVLSGLFFVGCSGNHTQAVQQASQSISDSLGCVNMQSKVFDAFYSMIDQKQLIPRSKELKAAMDEKINELSQQEDNQSKTNEIDLLRGSMHELIDLLLSESERDPSITWKEQVQKLIEYEMEDQSDASTIVSTKQISQKISQIKIITKSLTTTCTGPVQETKPDENASVPAANSSSQKVLLMAQGLNKVFATAYQSCRVLDLPEMDRATTYVKGITKSGSHEDGIGGKRYITDLKSVQNTHYYIRGIASESNCKDVKNNPLIYDYGGSPQVTSTSINFFANAGSGTEVLGVDCSAFISSGIAASGLRYKPGLENKTIYIRQNSKKFIDASTSGFSCFENVTVSKNSSIKPGDIVGVAGHVVAVDKVGDDPFGLRLLKSTSDCETINYKNFDVVISQSSPSKNGIGINKYSAKDYLEESGKMRTAFVSMGKQACLAYFNNKSIKPKSADWGFLRHKGTAECLAPQVHIEGESCTKKCI